MVVDGGWTTCSTSTPAVQHLPAHSTHRPTQLQHGYAGPPTALLPFSIHQHTAPTDPHSYNTAMLDHPQHYCRSVSTSTHHPPTHTATTRLCWTTHSTTAVQYLPALSTHRPTQLQHGYAGPPTALLPFSIYQHSAPTDVFSWPCCGTACNTSCLSRPAVREARIADDCGWLQSVSVFCNSFSALTVLTV